MDYITLFLNWFDSLPDVVEALIIFVTSLVTVATAITSATPTKIDDEKLPVILTPLNWILSILNFIAGNVGKNKNKDAE